MVAWKEFAAEAPRIAEVFLRRHAATANLCLLATLRSDGYPRISPIEPRVFDGELVIVGMPNTTKFRDLDRDPRFCLHTATIDPYVAEGDVKLWADARSLGDPDFQSRFAQDLYEATGFDLRGKPFDSFFVADMVGASSLILEAGQLVVTIWRPGEGEEVVTKA